MTQAAAFTLEQMTAEVLRGIIETVGERADDTPARKSIRHATTVFSVMAFLPRDAVELMLAGQCVIFDHVLRDGARDLLRGQEEKVKSRVRPQLVSAGNAFLKHLDRATQLQKRPIEQIAALPHAEEEPVPAEKAKPATQPRAQTPNESKLAAMLPGFAPMNANSLVSGGALAAAAGRAGGGGPVRPGHDEKWQVPAPGQVNPSANKPDHANKATAPDRQAAAITPAALPPKTGSSFPAVATGLASPADRTLPVSY